VHDDIDLPRLVPGGQWLATPGKFFPGYGRDITEPDLVAAAVEEARASSGWCKIIGDWLPGVPPVRLDVLSDAVAAVHAIGGRVAVHSQTAEGSRNAVLAGADSLEHGMYLDHELLPRMAERGIALVPTFTTFAKTVDQLRTGGPPEHIRDWLVGGWESLLKIVPAAHEAGVTVLAGTDSKPCGEVAGEVEWLLRAGLPIEAAVGAASWAARSWLGLPGLVDGAPADIVAYDANPLEDPTVLKRPSRIILRGRLVR
jgi:imidazolonepropionase-like amidohydrolase